MKIKTLAIAAGVSAPLILSGSVSAGFVGIKTTWKPNDFGLLVVNVYANFDRPGEDFMVAVAGSPNNPLTIVVEGGGTFYNHAFGTDHAPNAGFFGVFPSLAFDTFVSIGKKTSAGDATLITAGWPFAGIVGSVFTTDSSGWGVTPNAAQANPFDPANSFPGNSQILIAQFSTADGTGISGTMLLQFISNGAVETQVLGFGIPTPGALAIMAVAGWIGIRRRRRQGRE